MQTRYYSKGLAGLVLSGSALRIRAVREIVFFRTELGDSPVENFLDSQSPDVRAKIVRTLELLRTLPMVPSKFWQKMRGTSSLWELRVEYGGNIFRVLATTAKANRVILLHAFQKKSQKTPLQDIEIATQRQKRYFQRHGYL